MTRRRAVGAELVDGGVSFRVWAPARRAVSAVVDGVDHDLDREDDGHFCATVAGARAGSRYRFRLDGEREAYPDPASRFQPDGPHGDSLVVDPGAYRWRADDTRPGVSIGNAVVYEIHIGTFTPAGTWRAAIEKLPHLRDLGVTILEVMPVAEFPGRFGWGYDGVDLWAPLHLYGEPDDFRAFVDAAHAHGLGVILDVVYNHFGPDGCYLAKFSPDYFSKKYWNEWGEAINFDDEKSEGAREFFTENAAYWIDEFHLDGLRLDATQSIHDLDSPEHILKVIARCARAAAGERPIVLVAENEPQDARIIDEYGIDALWNDDWHHAAGVAAGGRREAYYTDYRGTAQEFVSMARYGFLYQGQRYSWQKKPRGTPSLHLPRERLVCYLQNHDQVANTQRGERPPLNRALTALLLLGANTPMLFQGQEFAASTPFLYFADHKPELAAKVVEGRREFLKQFPSIDRSAIDLPHDPRTFERCKLDWSEREQHAEALALHRELLRLRRPATNVEGAILGERALVLRFTPTRLLLVNFGETLRLEVADEPLLAPPRGQRWRAIWPDGEFEEWVLPAESAVLLEPFRSAAA